MRNKKRKFTNLYIHFFNKSKDNKIIILLLNLFIECPIFKSEINNVYYIEKIDFVQVEKLNIFLFRNKYYSDKISFIITPIIKNELPYLICQYRMFGIHHLADVCFELIKLNNFNVNIFKKIFLNVPSHTLKCVSAYIRTSLSLDGASKMIFMHRNSINYQINNFYKITNIDVRENMNAILVYLILPYLE